MLLPHEAGRRLIAGTPAGQALTGTAATTRSPTSPRAAAASHEAPIPLLPQHGAMAKYLVNDDAVAVATELIDKRRYVLRSRWDDVRPTAADGTR
jgi:hypothetical protein